MGFKPQRRRYRLTFEDPELAGLEVVARSATVGAYQEIATLADVASPPTAEDVQKINHLYKAFADVLISWNIEDEADQPVPATLEGLLTQDMVLILQIIRAWMEAVASVDLDLGAGAAAPPDLPMDIHAGP